MLNPVLNLLTAESQYAYKQKKSSINVPTMVNKVLTNNATRQLILFDFAKAFGNIERDILRVELYESGLQFNVAKKDKNGTWGKQTHAQMRRINRKKWK